MDKDVISILTLLSKAVNIINTTIEKGVNIDKYEPYCEIRSKIKSSYMTFKKQKKLFSLLENDFSNDVHSQIYLLSILLKCTHDIQIIEQIVKLIKIGNLDPYFNSRVEFQLTYELFTNNYTQDLRRILHSFNVNRFRNVFDVPTEYVPYQNRNKNRIAIITEQLLSLSHAPSRVVLEQCYALKKELGMDVMIFVCPVIMTEDDLVQFHDSVNQNYINELNGDFILKYNKEDILQAPKKQDGIFYIQYKDVVFSGMQKLFTKEYIQSHQYILNFIYEYNPLFVYNMNSINPIADLCTSFTTVVAGSMSYGIPVSEAQILLYLENSDATKSYQPSYSLLEDSKQIAMNFKWDFSVEESDVNFSKSDFGIDEDDFVISIVGNRLLEEITQEFIHLLERILLLDPRISIMIIGISADSQLRLDSAVFQDRVHFLGYQEKLAAVLKTADLYLNPPRKGGGTSALYALNVGVPVITLPDCDVAKNVGETYVCQNNNEILEMVSKCLSDREYYEYLSKQGKEYTHNFSNYKTILNDATSKIKEIIMKTEDGTLF